MTRLFSYQWEKTQGQMLVDGDLSDSARLWLNTIGGLDAEAKRRGCKELESRIKEAAKEGKDYWPPNDIQFSAMCEKKSEPRYYKPFRHALPVDDKTKARRKKAGDCELSKMREMLGDL